MVALSQTRTEEIPETLSYKAGTCLWIGFFGILYLVGWCFGVLRLEDDLDEANGEDRE